MEGLALGNALLEIVGGSAVLLVGPCCGRLGEEVGRGGNFA